MLTICVLSLNFLVSDMQLGNQQTYPPHIFCLTYISFILISHHKAISADVTHGV